MVTNIALSSRASRVLKVSGRETHLVCLFICSFFYYLSLEPCELDVSDARTSMHQKGMVNLLMRNIVKNHQVKYDHMFLGLVPCMLTEENLKDGDFTAHVLQRVLEIRSRSLEPPANEVYNTYLGIISWIMFHILPQTLLSLTVSGNAERATINAFCNAMHLDGHCILPAAGVGAVTTSVISSSESTVGLTLADGSFSVTSPPMPTGLAEDLKRIANFSLSEAAHAALNIPNPTIVVPSEAETTPTKCRKGKKKKEKERTCAMEGCGVVGSGLKMCGGCKKVFYCTVAHQKEHWQTHKTVCQSL